MKRILLLILTFVAFGCTQKGGSILKDAASSPSDKIIGKYYVTDFTIANFKLLEVKPENQYFQQLLEF